MHTFIGTAYARGKQHGSELAQAIRNRARRTLPIALDIAERTRIAQPWIDASEALDTNLVREMAGIAAGSGTTLVDVALLNSFEAFNLAERMETGGCTAIGVATNGRTVLAQNWDANPQLAIGLSIHLHRDPDAPEVAVLASPGSLGWIGMNECGLALVNNDLLGGPTALAAPSQVIRRVLLKNPSASSALSAMHATEHPALRSYMLADSTGTLVGVEVLPYERPETVASPTPEMVHTNHAVTPRARTVENKNLQESLFPSSAHRARRAAELLEQNRQETDQHRRVRRLLSDHDGIPLSICRHVSRAEATVSAASLVFDCTARRAGFHLGFACKPHTREVIDLSTAWSC